MHAVIGIIVVTCVSPVGLALFVCTELMMRLEYLIAGTKYERVRW